jgi:hypothetical protein
MQFMKKIQYNLPKFVVSFVSNVEPLEDCLFGDVFSALGRESGCAARYFGVGFIGH